MLKQRGMVLRKMQVGHLEVDGAVPETLVGGSSVYGEKAPTKYC